MEFVLIMLTLIGILFSVILGFYSTCKRQDNLLSAIYETEIEVQIAD